MRNIGLRKMVLALGCVTAFVPAAATAQTTGRTNKEFVRDLFFQNIVDPQESVILPVQIASGSADAIAKLVVVALSSAPVASSSAGFSYVRNATTGELSLRSDSFGPTFAERPLTNGAGIWNFGVNFQFSSISFNGGFGTADGKTDGLPMFDNTWTYGSARYPQYITERGYLRSQTSALQLAVSYGATDRLDVGVLVPIVQLKLTGHVEAAFDTTAEFKASGQPFSTPTGIIPLTAEQSQSASGIGDLTLRLKYSLSSQKDEGVAVAADVRLPTGDEDNLLGTGKASVKMMLLLSKSGLGPASVHANAGYTAGGLSDEVNYVVGTDAALLPKKQLTASISLLGRTLRGAALPTRLRTVTKDQDGVPGRAGIAVDRFIWSNATLNLLDVAAGVKYQVGPGWLLDASVLFPVNQRGFQPGIYPVVGLERTWGGK